MIKKWNESRQVWRELLRELTWSLLVNWVSVKDAVCGSSSAPSHRYMFFPLPSPRLAQWRHLGKQRCVHGTDCKARTSEHHKMRRKKRHKSNTWCISAILMFNLIIVNEIWQDTNNVNWSLCTHHDKKYIAFIVFLQITCMLTNPPIRDIPLCYGCVVYKLLYWGQ